MVIACPDLEGTGRGRRHPRPNPAWAEGGGRRGRGTSPASTAPAGGGREGPRPPGTRPSPPASTPVQTSFFCLYVSEKACTKILSADKWGYWEKDHMLKGTTSQRKYFFQRPLYLHQWFLYVRWWVQNLSLAIFFFKRKNNPLFHEMSYQHVSTILTEIFFKYISSVSVFLFSFFHWQSMAQEKSAKLQLTF